MRPSRSEVLDLLLELDVPFEVVAHSKRVAGVAVDLASRIAGNGNEVDLWLVETGSLVHDIGRARTHSINHGIEGSGMIRSDPLCLDAFSSGEIEALARICERHIGGGIPSKYAVEAGLPPVDYLPVSIEEKIVTHADNLVWNGVLTFEESLAAYEGKFGRDSPIFMRIAALGEEIEGLAGEVDEGSNYTRENLPKSS
jgi:uncharacterized protein